MDLNKLKPAKAEEGAVLELVHPDTEEVIPGMTIRLLGYDSSVYRKIALKKQQAALNRISKGKKAMDLKAEQIEEDTIEELVALTVEWTGFEMEGEALPCNPENKRMVYSDWRWIKEQAQEFVANRANFFR